jgi:hypothetical protein
MPAVIVMLIVLSIYFVFVTCYLPVAGLPLSSLQSIGFHGLTSLSFLAYYLGATTDPGGIPENDIWRNNPPPLLEKKKSSGERRFCHKELKFKPDRCHYCSPMNRNVLRMDHYCPWLVNCVGYNNHKFFYLFILYSTIAVDWCSWSLFHAIYFGAAHSAFSAKTFFLVEGLGLTSLLAGLLTPFLAWHTWLISENMTTIEFCEQRERGQYSSKYNIGVARNIQSILGKNMFFWLLPFSPRGRGDGLQYWLRRGAVEPDENEPEDEKRLREQLEVTAEPVLAGFVSVLGESLSELGTDCCTICLDFNEWRIDLFARAQRIVVGGGAAPPRNEDFPARPAERASAVSQDEDSEPGPIRRQRPVDEPESSLSSEPV